MRGPNEERTFTRAHALRLLVGGGAGLALLGGGGYAASRLLEGSAPAETAPGRRVLHFHSRRDLRPAAVTISKRAPGRADGLLFLAPSAGPGYRGVMIVDDAGELVWFRRTYPQTAMDFRAGLFRGRPVLTWWEALPGHGLGNGVHVVVDSAYRDIARFPAANGLPSDLHELRLTDRGTALLTSFDTHRRDLRHVGGSRKGLVTEGIAQEVTVPDGRLVHEWRSLDHVPVEEAYNPIGYPWDYFHINSIDVDEDGDLLVSGRNTWTVYKVDRDTGRVRWRLGGKRSDFELGKGARFAYQHDARHHPGGLVSVFDNGGAERAQIESQSRALVLALDHRRRRATVARQYTHDPPLLGRQMGNAQRLPNGNWFIGWGTDPHFTEYRPDGMVVLDGGLPEGGQCYRTFRFPWVGHPEEPPALARRGATLYVSWNGATEVASWRLEAGNERSTHPKRGFETALPAPRGASATVVALDAAGRELGRSTPV